MFVIVTFVQLLEMFYNVREFSFFLFWFGLFIGDIWIENRFKLFQIGRYSGQKVIEVFYFGMEIFSCVVDIMWKSLIYEYFIFLF